MSYILDALRRADAERERDPARGIHAHPGAGAPAAGRTPIPGRLWPVGALAVAGAALAFAWQRPGGESAAPQVAVGQPDVVRQSGIVGIVDRDRAERGVRRTAQAAYSRRRTISATAAQRKLATGMAQQSITRRPASSR